METELVSLRTEIEMRRQREAVLENENDSQRRTIARLQAERDNAIRRADQIKVLLDQCGASLVSGIQKFHANEREIEQAFAQDETRFLSDASKTLPSVKMN